MRWTQWKCKFVDKHGEAFRVQRQNIGKLKEPKRWTEHHEREKKRCSNNNNK